MRRVAATALCLSMAWSGPVWSENAMYRYRNDQGVLVVDFSIPPQYVEKGYEVVSPNGRLIREVPARGDRLSQEAIARRKAQEREDTYILRSFSSIADIERARERKRSMVAREIDILQSNLKDFDLRREALRQKAANYQASGQETPPEIARVLSDLDEHEENTHRLLADRRVQIEEIDEQFDRYIERLILHRPSVALEAAGSEDDGGSDNSETASPGDRQASQTDSAQ